MNTKHDTRPNTDAIHADLVACRAARRARLMGADVAECATIYTDVYARTMREQG